MKTQVHRLVGSALALALAFTLFPGTSQAGAGSHPAWNYWALDIAPDSPYRDRVDKVEGWIEALFDHFMIGQWAPVPVEPLTIQLTNSAAGIEGLTENSRAGHELRDVHALLSEAGRQIGGEVLGLDSSLEGFRWAGSLAALMASEFFMIAEADLDLPPGSPMAFPPSRQERYEVGMREESAFAEIRNIREVLDMLNRDDYHLPSRASLLSIIAASEGWEKTGLFLCHLAEALADGMTAVEALESSLGEIVGRDLAWANQAWQSYLASYRAHATYPYHLLHARMTLAVDNIRKLAWNSPDVPFVVVDTLVLYFGGQVELSYHESRDNIDEEHATRYLQLILETGHAAIGGFEGLAQIKSMIESDGETSMGLVLEVQEQLSSLRHLHQEVVEPLFVKLWTGHTPIPGDLVKMLVTHDRVEDILIDALRYLEGIGAPAEDTYYPTPLIIETMKEAGHLPFALVEGLTTINALMESDPDAARALVPEVRELTVAARQQHQHIVESISEAAYSGQYVHGFDQSMARHAEVDDLLIRVMAYLDGVESGMGFWKGLRTALSEKGFWRSLRNAWDGFWLVFVILFSIHVMVQALKRHRRTPR